MAWSEKELGCENLYPHNTALIYGVRQRRLCRSNRVWAWFLPDAVIGHPATAVRQLLLIHEMEEVVA